MGRVKNILNLSKIICVLIKKVCFLMSYTQGPIATLSY